MSLNPFKSSFVTLCKCCILHCHLIFTLQIKHREDVSLKAAICMLPFITLNTYQMGVKLLPGRVW